MRFALRSLSLHFTFVEGDMRSKLQLAQTNRVHLIIAPGTKHWNSVGAVWRGKVGRILLVPEDQRIVNKTKNPKMH